MIMLEATKPPLEGNEGESGSGSSFLRAARKRLPIEFIYDEVCTQKKCICIGVVTICLDRFQTLPRLHSITSCTSLPQLL